MISRRRFLAAAAPLCLLACAAPPPAPTQTAAPATRAKVVWSNWAVDAGSKARLDEQKRLYEAAAPVEVEVQNTPIAEYVAKLLASFVSDQAPDVIRLNTDQLGVLFNRKQVAELDPLFQTTADAWIKRSDVKTPIVDKLRIKSAVVGLPYGGDMDALFVNKTLFKGAGLPPPPTRYEDPDWTYARLLGFAKQLTKRRPDGAAEQLGIDVGGYRYEGHVENAGGSWFTADGMNFQGHQPPAVAALDYLASLVLTHKVAATPGTDDARANNFASGRLAMSWLGASQVSNRLADVGDRFEWDVAPVPRWGSNPLVVKSGFSALSLNSKSKVRDAAWGLLHWVTGPVGSLPDVETGWSLPVFTGLDGRYFARTANLNKNLLPAVDGVKYPSKFPPWTNPNYAEAWRRVQTALDLVFLGKGTAGDLLSAVKPEVDQILAKAT